MTKNILLGLPDKVHEILVSFKKASGIAVTSQIKAYTYKGMLNDRLVSLKELKEE